MTLPFPEPDFIRTNGIRMAVYQQGCGLPVIFCHGFPELAFSWRKQLSVLAEAGYRAIAPDLRGYGKTEKPEAIEAYDILNLVDDLTGLLDALELDRAIFCGHDWGGHVVWEMPAFHPERVAGIIALNTPHRYFQRMGPDPIRWMLENYSDRYYRMAFLEKGIEMGLTAEVLPAFLGGLFRARPMTMEQYLAAPPSVRNLEFEFILEAALAPEPAGVPLMSRDELQVYIDAFKEGGLTGPINWYRNIVRNARILDKVDSRIEVPCLMISAADDIFLPPSLTEGMESHCADLEKYVLPECGHWSQSEKPAEVNRLILDWLERKFDP
ncbi:MAG: alpha/beta hydrolase [Syntrophotaleaceae bacterium]